MDKQEALNKNWEWFVVQRKPQSAVWGKDEEEKVCVYRGDNGCRCAIGVLIPDEDYDPDMEECGFSKDFAEQFAIDYLFEDLETPYWIALQKTHDAWNLTKHGDFTEYMRKELTELAKEHDLTMPNTTTAA